MKHHTTKALFLLSVCLLLSACSSSSDSPTTSSVSFISETVAETTTEEETTEATTEADTTAAPSEETTEPAPEEAPEETPAETFAEYQMYAAGSVNIRSGPGSDQEVLGQTGDGDSITVIGPEENGWLPVNYNGQTAYMSAQFLSDTAPTQAPANSGGGSGKSGGSGNGSNFNTYDNPEQHNTSETYVLNTNTKKFHKPGCSSVEKISPSNYDTSSDSRDALMSRGYSPCKRCNP